MKRKHSTLSLDTKLNIILDEIKYISSYSFIVNRYNIGKSNICDNKWNEKKIRNFIEDRRNFAKKRKTTKPSQNSKWEEAIFIWSLQKQAINFPVSNQILLQKTEWFQTHFNTGSVLKASEGWLRRFKERFRKVLENWKHLESVYPNVNDSLNFSKINLTKLYKKWNLLLPK